MTERKLKSYDDIADYLLERLQFSHVNELPDEFFELFSEYGSVQTIPLYFSQSKYYMSIQLEWFPPNRLVMTFLDVNQNRVQTFTYGRAAKKEVSNGEHTVGLSA